MTATRDHGVPVPGEGGAHASATHDDEVHGPDATPVPLAFAVVPSGPGVVLREHERARRQAHPHRPRHAQRPTVRDPAAQAQLALPVFASDALVGGLCPDEILLTLGMAGGALAVTQSWKIGLAVAFVMVIVVMSYRQNVHAYPSGAVTTRWPASTSARRPV